MFYSHDILKNQQHGVATIWLVATVGPRGNLKRVTRKAIQEVDVEKACQQIMEPGAPIALRLQGTLLYGVSRVYSHQCNYVLADVEKVQHDMRLFYKMIGSNETDPQAGQARREQNILQDDPSFILSATIPRFEMPDEADFARYLNQPSSHQQYSLLSPADGKTFKGANSSALLEINIPQSQRSDSHLPSPFGPPSANSKGLMSAQPGNDAFEPLPDLDLFGDMDFGIGDDQVNFLIQEDGTILETRGLAMGEPALPPLSPLDGRSGRHEGHGEGVAPTPAPLEDDVPMLEHSRQNEDTALEGHAPASEVNDGKRASAHARRGRKPKITTADDRTQLNMRMYSMWRDTYVDRMEAEKAAVPKTPIAEARSNARHFVLGQGLGGIGMPVDAFGSKHPLAEYFAGDGLCSRIFGGPSADHNVEEENRRRSASRAFGDDKNEEGRRVRARVDETPQRGQNPLDEDMVMNYMDDNQVPELGREDPGAFDERLSSSIMPWARTPSVHAPSSVQGKLRTATPGSSARLADRFNDALGSHRESNDLGQLRTIGSVEPMEAGTAGGQETQDSQWMSSAIDQASHEFLEYAKEQAAEVGGILEGDVETRLWVEFEELAVPRQHPGIVAAQAFYHVLTLATKNIISVEQDVENNQPFGTIHIGIDMTDEMQSDDN